MKPLEIIYHPKRTLHLLRQLLSLPKVTIRMSGDKISKNLFEFNTKSHPSYKFIQHKRWGVGLLPLPDLFEDYLKGKDKQALRSNRRRSTSLGFQFNSFDTRKHIEEILAINGSMRFRQGRPIDPPYLSLEHITKWAEERPVVDGVFDTDGVLKAYAHTVVCGEVSVIVTLLGHADDLEKGIMYLLISEIIRDIIERKRKLGTPLWVMYDTFFGASDGLRYFKDRLGFKPYKVTWVWVD